jgi:hypothetical protein
MDKQPSNLHRFPDATQNAHEPRRCPPTRARPGGRSGEVARPQAQQRVGRLKERDDNFSRRLCRDRGPGIRIQEFYEHALGDVQSALSGALIRDQPHIGRGVALLDPDPKLLPDPLTEHRREDLITYISPVRYDPEATAPRW